MRALLLAALAGPGCAGEAAEGRPWVKHVSFAGNRHFGKGELLDHISLSQTSWIPFSPKQYLDPITLEIDRKRLVAYYQAHGYFFARVTAVNVHPDGKGAVGVDIAIDEGPPTQISAVRIEGLSSLAPDVQRHVQRRLPVRAGDLYDEARYLRARDRLESRLREHGHAFARVEGEALVDRDARTAVVVFHAEPGPVAYYGRIGVTGTPEVEDVVRRSTFTPGRRFDPVDVDATRSRLNRTGLFSSVAVRVVPRLNAPSVADVEIEVRPGARNEFRAGIGVGLESDRQSVTLPLSYTRYGFLGGMRRLELRATPGWMALPTFWGPQRQGPLLVANAMLTQPDLFVRDLSLKVGVGYDLGVDYAFTFQGPRGVVGLQYQLLRDRLLFALSYNYQFLTFSNLAAPDVFNNPDLAHRFLGFTSPYLLAYLLASATLDLRDNALDARSGAYLTVAVEEGASFLGGRFDYQKITPDARVYVPFGRRVTLGGRVLFGRLFSQGDIASPITQRYYAGGADSHRGFNFNRLSPEVAASDGTLIPIGGDRLFLAQLDLRVNVVRIRGSWLGIGTFFDAGDVPDGGRSIDFTQLHLATGGGLRYHTPIGVIRVDIGVRLNRLTPFQPDGRQNPDPGDRVVYHLSIGEPF